MTPSFTNRSLDDSMIAVLRGVESLDLPTIESEWACEKLYRAACQAGLCGLLLESLASSPWTAPNWFRDRLTSETRRIAAVNRCAVRRLGQMAESFAESRIDLLVLKGAALLVDVYDDLGSRPMCDLDLLIRPHDVARADRLLERLGFRRGRNHLRKDFFPTYHYETEYLSTLPQPLRLDVHVRPWRPLRYSRIVPEDALWDAPRTVTLEGAAFRIPNDVNMLIHLLGHFAFHGARRLLWSVDIVRFVDRRGGQLDWDEWITRLERWKLLQAARLALSCVEGRFGPIVPGRASAALKTRRSSWKDRLATWQAPRDARTPTWHTVVDTLCTDGWAFRAGYLRAVLLPDRTHLAESYRARHWGWVLCAHFRRYLRRLVRSSPADVSNNVLPGL